MARTHLADALWMAQRQGTRGVVAITPRELATQDCRDGRPDTVAWRFGAAERPREEPKSKSIPVERSEYERIVSVLREALGQAAYERAWAAGPAAPLDGLIAEASDIQANIGRTVSAHPEWDVVMPAPSPTVSS